MNEHHLSHLAMEQLDAVCYIADMETYELLYLNERAKKIMGVLDEDFKGRKCYEVLQGNTEPCSFCTNHQLEKGAFYKWKFQNRFVDCEFELMDTIIEFEGKNARLEFAFDMTETNNRFKKLKTKLTFEETLLKCAQTLSEYKNIKSAIDKLLSIICQFFEADRAYIFELTEDEQFINNTYEWNAEGIEPQKDNLQMLDKSCVALWLERFEKEGEFFITSLDDDVDTQSDTYEILNAQGIESLTAAPLIIDGKTIGFLGVDNPKAKTRDTALIQSVTLFVTSELEKMKINEALQDSIFIDGLTKVYNRNKYIQVIDEMVDRRPERVGIVYLDMNELKFTNDTYGHQSGDRLIIKTVEFIKKYFPYDIFRIGGDEFIGLYFGNNQAEFEEASAELSKKLREQSDISVSMGKRWCINSVDIINQIIKAERQMYGEKQKYYESKKSERSMIYDQKFMQKSMEHPSGFVQRDLNTGYLPEEVAEKNIQTILDNSYEQDEHVLVMAEINHIEVMGELSATLNGDTIYDGIAEDLLKIMRGGDIVSRIGTDKVVLLLRNVSNLFSIRSKAEEVMFIFKKHLNQINLDLSAHIGVSRFQQNGPNYKELCENTYSALCAAKSNGPFQCCVYSKDTTVKQPILNEHHFTQKVRPNILLNAFRVLQTSNNIEQAINEVIELLGKACGASRTFIFELIEDGEFYSNTYEWCAKGIAPEIDNMQKIPKEKYLYMTSFAGDDGVFACSDLSEVEGPYHDLMEAQGVKSFLQGFVKVNGVPQILIGIDDCAKTRVWTKQEIETTLYLSNLVGMFSKQVENNRLMKKSNYLKSLVEVDTLTGIPSKGKFYLDTQEMLGQNRKDKFYFALVNVNKFQIINSFFGMEEGDRLLKLIASELGILGADSISTYGRMDADIFCVCQKQIGGIDETVDKMVRILNSSFLNFRFDYNLSASIGIYEIEDADMPIEVMYSKASMAAKKIKHLKVTSYSVYEEDMEQEAINEQVIVNEVLPGLIEKQFEVYLQPKVELETENIIGAEALVRWNHPTKGMIYPGEFIPIFEKNGMITKIDFFVWETVFQLLEEQIQNNKNPVPISVNISRVDLFNTNLLSCFEDLLSNYHVPSELVHLEITESAYTSDYEDIRPVISQLKDMGFHIEMDDFGTGYSSLNMFSEMIVDTLKLDMNFLRNLQASGEKHEILIFIISLARHYNLPVVAEGIETKEQLQFLKEIGCDIGQGYYFAKPMPIEQFLLSLDEMRHRKPKEQIEENVQCMAMQDILYPDTQWKKFFQNALAATAVVKVTKNKIEMIHCNSDMYDTLHVQNKAQFNRIDMKSIVHDDDVSRLLDIVGKAKKLKKMSSFDARIVDLSQIGDESNQSYNLFHICVKLINSNSNSDMFMMTFEQLEHEIVEN